MQTHAQACIRWSNCTTDPHINFFLQTSSCDESELSEQEEEEASNKNRISRNSNNTDKVDAVSKEEPKAKPSKMRDAFLSFSLFVVLTILTHGITGPSPFVLPAGTNLNEGTPAAAAPPNLRVRHAPPPTPFFGTNSAVDDYYGGDVYAAFAEADLHENALIFYYAPWDADSRATRKVLELIADVFADSDLYIGAVNCWTPKGECFKQVKPFLYASRSRLYFFLCLQHFTGGGTSV